MNKLWKCVTFLLQAEGGGCPLLILILPHEGLVHRHQLPRYLPIVLIHSEPAVTGEVVPADTRNLSDQNSNSEATCCDILTSCLPVSPTSCHPSCPRSRHDPGTKRSKSWCCHGGSAASSEDPARWPPVWKRPPAKHGNRRYCSVTDYIKVSFDKVEMMVWMVGYNTIQYSKTQ